MSNSRYFSSDKLEKRLDIVNPNKSEVSQLDEQQNDGVINEALQVVDEKEPDIMLERIYDLLSEHDDYKGLSYLMERDYKQLIKCLYELHVKDLLTGVVFEDYKAYLKQKELQILG